MALNGLLFQVAKLVLEYLKVLAMQQKQQKQHQCIIYYMRC